MVTDFYPTACRVAKSKAAIIMAALLLCMFCALSAFAAPPAVTATVQASGGWLTSGSTDMAVDSSGNMYVVEADDVTASTAGVGTGSAGHGLLYEIPAGGVTNSATHYIYTALSTTPCLATYHCNGIAVDAAGDVFFSGNYTTSSETAFYEMVNTNGTLGAPVKLISWSTVISATFDASGNLYYAKLYAGSSYNTSEIHKVVLSGTTVVSNTTIASGIVTNIERIAVDKAGNIFWADGSKVYEITAAAAAGTLPATGTSIGTFSGPTSVSVAPNQDLYVVDNTANEIIVIPSENGVLTTADQYVLAAENTSFGSGNSFKGTVVFSKSFTPGYDAFLITSWGQVIALSTHGKLGSAAVGSASTSSPTVNYYFNSAETISGNIFANGIAGSNGEFNLTSASTCANGSYVATATCTLGVTFTPKKVGNRKAAIVVTDGSGNVLNNFPISGIGQATSLAVSPEVQTTYNSGLTVPKGMAVDDSNNIYAADSESGSIMKIPAGGGTATTAVGGFTSPVAVAMDGAGNLFVADSGAQEVIEVPYISGAYAAANKVVLGSGFTSPNGVATDNVGNVYVSDSGIAAITKLSPTGHGYYKSTIGTGLSAPSAVAVDGSNNVFVADSTNKNVVEIPAGGASQVTVASGLVTPNGIAFDPAGSVYISDAGIAEIVYVPYTGGAFGTQADAFGSFTAPQSVAFDHSGNLYVSDTTPAVYELNRSSAVLNFSSAEESTTGATLDASVYDVGNLPLTFTTDPVYTAAGNTADFMDVSGTSLCSTSSTLATGSSCVIAEQFSPIGVAAYSDVLTLVDDTSKTITLNGTGVTSIVNTTTTLALTSSSTVYGATDTVTATVTPVSGSGAPNATVKLVSEIAVPTGTVTFTIDGTAMPAVPLSGTGTASYSAVFTAGAHNVMATYSGDSNAATSVTSSPLSVTITKAALTVTAANASMVQGASLPAFSGTVTGVVNNDGITATYSTTATSSSAVGTYPITATLVDPGSRLSNYSVTNTPGTLTITAPAVGVATVSTISTLVLTHGSTATELVTVGASGALSGTVVFSCSGLPAGLSCSVSPASIDASKLPTTVTLTIGTTSVYTAHNNAARRVLAPLGWTLAMLLPGLFFAGRNRKHRMMLLAAAVVLLLTFSLTGCGNNNGSSSSGSGSGSALAAGSYTGTFTVTPTGAKATTATFTVTLK